MKEEILFGMIAWDWFTHILVGLGYTDFFIYQWWKILVLGVGYNLFWAIYWGIGVILACLIMKENKK